AAFATKALGDHFGGIVIAVTGKVADRHGRIRNPFLDQPLDFTRIHCHCSVLARYPMKVGNQPSCASLSSTTGMARARPSFKDEPPVVPMRTMLTPFAAARAAAESLDMVTT